MNLRPSARCVRLVCVSAVCLVITSGAAFAQGPDPNAPYVESVTYGGSGCPQGSVGQSISSDRTHLTLIFDVFVASTGPRVPVTEARKNCQINLNLRLPAGAGDVCIAPAFRGYVQAPAGVTATQRTIGSYPTDDPTPISVLISDGSFPGPVNKDYLETGGLTVPYSGVTSQVKPANLNTSVRLDPTGQSAQMTTDSFDATIAPGACAGGDTTPPVITASPSIAANANGWNNTDVIVSFTCTDDSGVNNAASSLAPVTLTGTGSATGTCVDNAGNSASATYTAHIDKVAPTIAVTSPVSGGLYGLGASVVSAFTCADDNSGVSACTGPASLSTASIGPKLFSVTVTDLAGNTASATVPYAVGGKDECKDGGSGSFIFPKFKNQGQCVSAYSSTK